jgi:hypothetical protein
MSRISAKASRFPDNGMARLDLIRRLEEELAHVPEHSQRHRELAGLISAAADAYRKSLDIEQALARHDPHPRK